MIIGLGYKKESGKDTAADALVREFGFTKLSFSDFMFDEILDTLPDFIPELYKLVMGAGAHSREELRDMLARNPRHPAVRRLLQNWGTELRRAQDEFYWANQMVVKIRLMDPRYRKVVITNVRFRSEFQAIKHNFDDVFTVRVDRPGLENFDTHASDTEGATLPWDYVINNDGTIADLEVRIIALVDKLASK